MKEFLFIISTGAGSSKKSLKAIITKEMKEQNLKFNIIETLYQGHAAEIAIDYARKKGSQGIVIVCGGDGTLNEVASVLAHTETAMGVLPTGTANDFSRSIYEKRDIETILSQFSTGFISPIDLLKVIFMDGEIRYCLNVCSFGFDTLILKEAYRIKETMPKLKAKAYYFAIVKSLFKINHHPFNLQYTSRERKFSKKSELILGAICNGNYYGNGFNPNPNGTLNNGKAFLVILEDAPLIKIPGLILKYKKGKHIDEKNILTEFTDKGVLEFTENILCNIDGEIFTSNKIEWTVEQKALPLFQISHPLHSK